MLSLLRFGRTIDQAAAAVGTTVRALAAAATVDGELRTALDGLPVEVQRAARLGDYLAALTRTGGDRDLAATVCGMTRAMVEGYRYDQETFATAEAAVLAMVGASPPAKARVTDAQLDEVARLLEGGASIAKAAEAAGVGHPTNLRVYAKRHPRLAAALPPRKDWPIKTAKKSPERFARLRELWADKTLSYQEIADDLGVSVSSVRLWAAELGLPRRSRLARREALEERRRQATA
ncbi:hypothetical protein ACTWP5_27520 [Streptomyces sp. 4N509B]|uniref:hypothetical protein n=1 Tax=Streptomyces sp. 4N509B TaxID=3457413 RepID=UPI003FD49331